MAELVIRIKRKEVHRLIRHGILAFFLDINSVRYRFLWNKILISLEWNTVNFNFSGIWTWDDIYSFFRYLDVECWQNARSAEILLLFFLERSLGMVILVTRNAKGVEGTVSSFRVVIENRGYY
ncbi:unnamed protein product [Rhizophagus irregularis]|nr:unnamed protein product [Rhizophagus irregularis]